INWMRAREGLFESPLFGEDIQKLKPILTEGASDSAIFDQALELLVMAGRPLPHAIMMMIPEAWNGDPRMDAAKRAFYAYHGCLMEPWDGPASIAFTDGRYIGAVLDRNGLRPSRYWITKDDLCIMASEVGVLSIPQERVTSKGRLQPGRMFLIDTVEGRLIPDAELKSKIAGEKPYGEWIRQNLAAIENLPEAPHEKTPDHETVVRRQMTFGYTVEDKRVLIGPTAQAGEEPIGSMGTDTPLAVLSGRTRPLFDYFKQLFAQVTNPPLDAIREELVTSVETTVGPEGNLLEPAPGHCRQIRLENPVLTNEELEKLKNLADENFRAITLPILFPRDSGAKGLEKAMGELCERASDAIRKGFNVLVLSDRAADEKKLPIPSLLAVAGVHHHLVREGTRTRAGLILESGEPREPHHFCLLTGYGAGAINPYLVFDTIDDMIQGGELPGLDHKKAVKNYCKAMRKALVKVMSKMGISTIQSYRGAQIFEAIGINRDVIDRYFTHTVSRIGGVGLDQIAKEAQNRHDRAYPRGNVVMPHVEWGGEYQFRRNGEYHLNNPDTVAKLQHSVRSGSYKLFKEYSKHIDDQSKQLCTLRGLFDLKYLENPIPIEEVESVESLVKRFKTGAMSFGSISREAHETLAIAMNRIGGKSNTGEGGEDPGRYVPLPNGDLKRSAIKQVASARFGVTSEYLVNADELQIKMAQGAKPGEGGQLPGHKVSEEIASVRHSTPGVGLISPPPHHDIYSIEDLAQLIYDLKNANNRARINVKLVAEAGVGTVAAGVAKAHADVILIAGHDGGTGASPLTSIKHAGVPWELGLAETHQVLVMNNLRSRVVVETDGQLKSGRDVAVAALLGAEEFGFATASLIAMGCIMMRVCHLNTCPVGVATQDPRLREKFEGKPEHVVNFMRFIAEELREHMARLGFRTLNEMIGRTDKINMKRAIDHWKARGLDLSPILHRPDAGEGVGIYCQMPQDHGLDLALDNVLIERCRPALQEGKKVEFDCAIRNVDRTVGTMLGAEVTRKYGGKGLPDDTIRIRFKGSAGQSFGAFLPPGLTFSVEGDANDYFGKGLSGGRILLYPPREATFVAEENIIAGNVLLYGATSGECYIRGLVGERFCVRNSGAHALVEGVGDHGCEYMTGGRVVVIGPTGRNFAAGMSGGIAYVLDESGDFEKRCNLEMVGLEPFEQAGDVDFVKSLIERHVRYTGSTRGKRVLENWESLRPKFVKVMPHDYKRVLQQRAA
ncbi:MAG: glutamate synthase large subunit, partial [Bdellovibrionota bacterium]